MSVFVTKVTVNSEKHEFIAHRLIVQCSNFLLMFLKLYNYYGHNY